MSAEIIGNRKCVSVETLNPKHYLKVVEGEYAQLRR